MQRKTDLCHNYIDQRTKGWQIYLSKHFGSFAELIIKLIFLVLIIYYPSKTVP